MGRDFARHATYPGDMTHDIVEVSTLSWLQFSVVSDIYDDTIVFLEDPKNMVPENFMFTVFASICWVCELHPFFILFYKVTR